jgi:hypothetical protein
MDSSRKYNNSNNKDKTKNFSEKKQSTEQTYRFRRVLGDILKYLKNIPDIGSFEKAKNEFGEQLTELIQRGFTWGYEHSIPVHDSDFKALEKKEWAAIRAIVRKQEYGVNDDI